MGESSWLSAIGSTGIKVGELSVWDQYTYSGEARRDCAMGGRGRRGSRHMCMLVRAQRAPPLHGARLTPAVWWAVSTFYPVGAGHDIAPYTLAEVIFTMVYLAVNVMLWSFIIGSISLLVARADEDSAKYRHRMVRAREGVCVRRAVVVAAGAAAAGCCPARHCAADPAVLCCAVLCCAVLCCAVLCCAVPCRAVPCCAVLCRAVPAPPPPPQHALERYGRDKCLPQDMKELIEGHLRLNFTTNQEADEQMLLTLPTTLRR
jgi:hypothetical protein